jgi:hypothetical protein
MPHQFTPQLVRRTLTLGGGKIRSLVTWDAVSGALNNMRFWHEDYPRLQEDIDRRARLTNGPFENVDLLSLKPSPAMPPVA